MAQPYESNPIQGAVELLKTNGFDALAVAGGPALAQDAGTPDRDQVVERPQPYSPYVDQHFPQQVLFGDMHHHTSLSVDSGLIGNKSGPDVSFRLARGEEVVSNTGQRVKLARPLDFLVVTDHAEYLGIAKLLAEADPTLLATDVGNSTSIPLLVALPAFSCQEAPQGRPAKVWISDQSM